MVGVVTLGLVLTGCGPADGGDDEGGDGGDNESGDEADTGAEDDDGGGVDPLPEGEVAWSIQGGLYFNLDANDQVHVINPELVADAVGVAVHRVYDLETGELVSEGESTPEMGFPVFPPAGPTRAGLDANGTAYTPLGVQGPPREDFVFGLGVDGGDFVMRAPLPEINYDRQPGVLSPMVDAAGNVYVLALADAGSSATLVALKPDGAERWRASMGRLAAATLTPDGASIYAIGTTQDADQQDFQALFELDAATGDAVGAPTEIPADVGITGIVAGSGDELYVSGVSPNSNLAARNAVLMRLAPDGTMDWSVTAGPAVAPNEDDNRRSHVLAVQPQTGNVCMVSSLEEDDGTVFNATSTLACAAPDGALLLGDSQGPTSEVWAGLAIASNGDIVLSRGTVTQNGVSFPELLRVGTPF